jgi:hypothetical protein
MLISSPQIDICPCNANIVYKLVTGVELSAETLRISNTHETVKNVHHKYYHKSLERQNYL